MCKNLFKSAEFDLPPKIQGIIEPISLIIHIAVKLRIRHFQKKNKINPKNDNVLERTDKHSLSDFTTNITNIIVFGSFFILTFKINRLDPLECNQFPNYIYIYLYTMMGPCVICFTTACVWYLRHEHLRREVSNEFRQIIDYHYLVGITNKSLARCLTFFYDWTFLILTTFRWSFIHKALPYVITDLRFA